MRQDAVYALGIWIEKGHSLSAKNYNFEPVVSFGNKIVKSIDVEMSDPRNFSCVPANIFVEFEDGSNFRIQAKDVLVYKGESQ